MHVDVALVCVLPELMLVILLYNNYTSRVQYQIKKKRCLAHGSFYSCTPIKYLQHSPALYYILQSAVRAQHSLLLTCRLPPPPPPARNAIARVAHKSSLYLQFSGSDSLVKVTTVQRGRAADNLQENTVDRNDRLSYATPIEHYIHCHACTQRNVLQV